MRCVSQDIIHRQQIILTFQDSWLPRRVNGYTVHEAVVDAEVQRSHAGDVSLYILERRFESCFMRLLSFVHPRVEPLRMIDISLMSVTSVNSIRSTRPVREAVLPRRVRLRLRLRLGVRLGQRWD